MDSEPLVTIALPVYNGADTLETVARSVLSQDYENVEFLISDNCSTDDTESVGRLLAKSDQRVRYHRQPHNIGLINNFEWTKRNGNGTYFRWIGDGDAISTDYVSKCLELFADDPRLILVTTQLEYLTNDGDIESMHFTGPSLRSADPVIRLREMLNLLTSSHLLLDPLYGLTRASAVARIRHDQMLRGDEVYSIKLALVGPWGHVSEILARRNWNDPAASQLASLLEVPRWHAPVRGIIEAKRMLAVVDSAHLPSSQARRAKTAVREFYLRRHARTLARRARRVRRELGSAQPMSGRTDSRVRAS